MKESALNYGRKLYPVLAIGFLLANVLLQFFFFKAFFLNPGMNGDERGYFDFINNHPDFSLSEISNGISQPYIFIGTLLNYFLHDTALTNRTISLCCGIFLLIYLFRYCKKNKFIQFVDSQPFFNDVALFSILFSVITIIRGHFVGTSDIISVAFAVPGFIMLTDAIRSDSRKNLWYVGLLFALAFTSRPTFLVVLLSYFVAFFIFYRKRIFSKAVISSGVFFIFFTALINFYPLTQHGKIVLDDKEPGAASGTSWFEMNYLVSKLWDEGAMKRTEWLSSDDVINYKKAHPDFVFPKNQFDFVIQDPKLFFKQMTRMFVISIYSSFRFLFLFFPLLIWFAFQKHRSDDRTGARFMLVFYFTALLLFMFMRISLMQFRWMHILLLMFAVVAMDTTKYIPEKSRLLIFNGTFLIGILFFIAGMIRDF